MARLSVLAAIIAGALLTVAVAGNAPVDTIPVRKSHLTTSA